MHSLDRMIIKFGCVYFLNLEFEVSTRLNLIRLSTQISIALDPLYFVHAISNEERELYQITTSESLVVISFF